MDIFKLWLEFLDHSMRSVIKKMMSLLITILLLTRTLSGAGLENGWDDFLLYDEDYEEDYDDTEDGNLDAELDYFFDYEEIGIKQFRKTCMASFILF